MKKLTCLIAVLTLLGAGPTEAAGKKKKKKSVVVERSTSSVGTSDPDTYVAPETEFNVDNYQAPGLGLRPDSINDSTSYRFKENLDPERKLASDKLKDAEEPAEKTEVKPKPVIDEIPRYWRYDQN